MRDRRAGVRGQEPALDQSLQVDGHVEARGPDAAAQPPHLAHHLPRPRRSPDQPPPEPRVDRHHAVEVGMAREQGVLARLHDPGQVDAGPRAAQGVGHREGVDDVAQRGELDDRDLQQRGARDAIRPLPARDGGAGAHARPNRVEDRRDEVPAWSGSWGRPRSPPARRRRHRRSLGHALLGRSRCPWRARRAAAARSERRRCPPRTPPPRPPRGGRPPARRARRRASPGVPGP